MPLEFTFACSLPNGLHARPAAQIADAARGFSSSCFLTNLRNGVRANLKSPLAIIAANVRGGDACDVSVSGSDQEAALAALQGFIQHDLPKSDEPLVAPHTSDKNGFVPRALRQAGVNCSFGSTVQRGIGQGKVVFIHRLVAPAGIREERPTEPSCERQRMEHALARVQSHIRSMLAFADEPAQKGVIKAQLSIVGDISLSEKLEEKIAYGRSASQAVVEAGEFFLAVFRDAESTYIQERALDLEDVLQQLLEEIGGSNSVTATVRLEEPSVAVAEMLSPQQLLSLERKWLKALVLQNGSTTSHSVILARSLGIPTVVGVKDALRTLVSGQEVVVDANRGLVVPCFETAVWQFYTREADLQRQRREAMENGAGNRAETADGRRMEVAANIAAAEESGPAFEQGADGIGVFRTEMLFVGRESTPTEDEQLAVYGEAARMAGEHPVIIRTLDIGADKPVAHLNLPRESNPYLGYRGVRIYPDFRDLVRTQVRAILRASAFGRIQMMLPMVSCVEEVVWARELVWEVQNELKAGNIAFDPAMPLGIMIETPSVAFMLDHLARELDFFSIGTNDLAQYFFAAERGNDKVSGLADVRHPAFLRFLRHIVKEVRKASKWVGMCGDMAADSRNLPLLVGMGLDEISVPACEIVELKQTLRRLSARSCEALLSHATACRRADEVEHLLRESQLLEGAQPLLTPALVLIDDPSESKEAAIRNIAERFYVAGRIDDPQLIQETIWDREAISSTGLGHGFAIPHCKTDAVVVDSVGILKLRKPIDWGARDGERVRMVIMLAVRQSQASNQHLQILSRLARKLMEQDFRAHLLSLDDAGAIGSYLSHQLGIGEESARGQ